MEPKTLLRALMPAVWMLLVALPVSFSSAHADQPLLSSHATPAHLADCWTCGSRPLR